MANTLAIAHDLEAAGFDRRQAEAVARAVDAASASSPTGIREEMLTKADFKIELGEVRNGIAGLDARITGLETQVAGLEARVAGLETQVVSLEAQVASLETQVAGLKAEVKDLKTGISKLETRMIRFGTAAVLTLVTLQFGVLFTLLGLL